MEKIRAKHVEFPKHEDAKKAHLTQNRQNQWMF